MDSWLSCPSCHLKHQRRPDGLCPRCKAAVDGAAAPAPTEAPASPYATPGEPAGGHRPEVREGLPTAVRIAGAIFVANALLNLIESASGDASGPLSGAGRGLVGVVIDALIGGSLLANNAKYLVWAKVRVALGMVVFVGLYLAQGDMLTAMFQVVLSCSLLALLLGEAGPVRTALGAIGAGGVVLLSLVGTVADGTGFNPLAKHTRALAYAGQTEPIPGRTVAGDGHPYTLRMPNDSWVLRKAEAVKKDNALADRWVVRPDSDAHVMVIYEELAPGSTLDMGAFEKVVMDNLRAGAEDVKLVRSAPALNGMYLETESSSDKLRIHHLYRLYADRQAAVQLVGFAPVDSFPQVSGEIEAIEQSFQLDSR